MGVTGLSVDLELTPGFPVTYGGAQSAGARDPPCLHPSERKRERERERERDRESGAPPTCFQRRNGEGQEVPSRLYVTLYCRSFSRGASNQFMRVSTYSQKILTSHVCYVFPFLMLAI